MHTLTTIASGLAGDFNHSTHVLAELKPGVLNFRNSLKLLSAACTVAMSLLFVAADGKDAANKHLCLFPFSRVSVSTEFQV